MRFHGVIVYKGLAAYGIQGQLLGYFKNAVKDAFLEAGRVWRDEFMHLHFSQRASQRYSYAPRGNKYLRMKARRYGGITKPTTSKGRSYDRKPLDLTGVSKAMLLGLKRDPKWETKLGRQGVSVPFYAPKHFFQWRGSGPDKPLELVTTTDHELARLSKVVKDSIQQRMNAAPQRTATRRSA